MADVWYTTRETVKAALDIAETARSNSAIDKAISSASRAIEGDLHRRFYPWTGTRYFDWPTRQSPTSWRLWLNANEIASVTTVVAGGVTIPSSDYWPRRADGRDEAPYTMIEINIGTSSAFAVGQTSQRNVAVTGVYAGCPIDEDQIGSLSADLAASTSATASITFTTAAFGVGDILRIGTERMIITSKSMTAVGQTLQANLTASMSDQTVAVAAGSAFAVDEVILIGAERMLVVDIAGNNLVVKRSWDGTTLAAHTATTAIYGLAGVDVDRAQLGTTLAAHTSGSPVYRFRPPGLIGELCVAEALNTLQQRQSAYARTVGSGDNEREASGRGLADIRREAMTAYGRQARTRAV